ncbi:hypothetical protein AN958_08098 [Leucoagaricus sp. SymC.cos]|nr:hypothetical protein AN958_08098 [Leucoagaricus sp. SymC.cos]
MTTTTWANNANPSLNVDGSASMKKKKNVNDYEKGRLRVQKLATPSTIKGNDYASAAFSTAYHQLQPLYVSTSQYGTRTAAATVQLPVPATIIEQTQSAWSSPVLDISKLPSSCTTTPTCIIIQRLIQATQRISSHDTLRRPSNPHICCLGFSGRRIHRLGSTYERDDD